MTWRQRAARWLDPTVAQWAVAPEEAPPPPPPEERTAGPWPVICEQFAMRILASAYQMGAHLEAVEADEQDPERLERLYRIDHANTRIRRHAENLQVLLGRRVEDADPQTVTMVDVVRAATSAVEYYPRIRVGHLVDLAVVEFAADDVIRVLTELLDNATRFSPPDSSVIVSAYITEDGSVLVRIEDAGVGIHPDHLSTLNALLGGYPPAPGTGNRATHLGLAVVAHLAVAHHLRVTLTNRPSGGTTATVLVPGTLLCETMPATALTAAGLSADTPTLRLTTLTASSSAERQPPGQGLPAATGELPRRARESVRTGNPPVGAHGPGTAGQHRSTPDDHSSPQAWPDETAAFAAGISDAQTTTSTDEGQLP